MAVSLKVLELTDERRQKAYRFTPFMERRLRKLRLRMPHMSETAILEAAVTHFLGTIERDHPIYVTIPSEPQEAPEEDEGA